MASNKMLSQEDIVRFRSEIQSEFGFYDPKVHSKLFSERVHRHLDHQMETIGIQSSEMLKRNLIQQTIVIGKGDVTLEDLKKSCTELRVHVPWKLRSVERKFKTYQRQKIVQSFTVSFILFFAMCLSLFSLDTFQNSPIQAENKTPIPMVLPLYLEKPSTPGDVFGYRQINHPAFIHYLSQKRNGLIGQSSYYYKIVILAKNRDIDPLLLFAIIGQEQSFVPFSNPEAYKIINNPFNVYHSWQDFNTDLSESTIIAINTLQNRLAKCPKDRDPFLWLNGIYAEDPNWHKGVKSFYLYFQKHFLLTNDNHPIPPIFN